MFYGNVLKDLRDANDLTQQDIANILNISRTTYKDYELQIRIIPLKHLNVLCNYFNISFDYIFGFVHDKNYKNYNNNIDNNIFYQRFKNFRKENKLTQQALAKVLNTSHSVISDYEKGKKIISTPFLYTICKKYNISADYLLGRINEPINLDI